MAKYATCKTCNRALFPKDADKDGNCPTCRKPEATQPSLLTELNND